MKALIKGLAIYSVLFVGSLVLALISPQLGLWLGACTFFVSLVAAYKPLPSIGLRHRGFNIAVAFGVALPVVLVSMTFMSAQDMVRLAELKESDPTTYLSELRASDEDRWLTELADIDPDQHTSEVARIADERVQREAEEQAIRAEVEAREIEKERAKVTAYIEQIDRELASMSGVRASNYTDSVQEINIALLVMGAWALLYEEGVDIPLDTEGQKKRQRFSRAVVRKQVEMFPALRDAYGPAMRRQLWEADGSARTIGAGYRTVEFVSTAFALNANIKKIHADIRENLMMLRFTRAQYKWFRQASEFNYYTLEVPTDRNIVKWQSGGRFRVLD